MAATYNLFCSLFLAQRWRIKVVFFGRIKFASYSSEVWICWRRGRRAKYVFIMLSITRMLWVAFQVTRHKQLVLEFFSILILLWIAWRNNLWTCLLIDCEVMQCLQLTNYVFPAIQAVVLLLHRWRMLHFLITLVESRVCHACRMLASLSAVFRQMVSGLSVVFLLMCKSFAVQA